MDAGFSHRELVRRAESAGVDLSRVRAIALTHEHGDHFNASAIPGLTNTGVRICSSVKVYSQLSTGLGSLTTPLTNGQSADFGGILVEAVPANPFA